MNTKNKICPFCGEIISIKKHLGICNPNVDINVAYIMMIELTFKCNVEDIICDYISGFSLPDIKTKYGLSYKVTTNVLSINDVSIRNVKESSNENKLNKYENC